MDDTPRGASNSTGRPDYPLTDTKWPLVTRLLGLDPLGTIRLYDVALYIESRQQTHFAPDMKQQFAAIRMLFDFLILGPDRSP
jgi:hypothetical protein